MAVFYCLNDLCDVASPKYQSGFEHDCLFSFDRGHLSDFYLLGGYLSKRRWWGKLADIQKTSPLQNYLSGGRTEEEKLVEEYINQLIREHQEVMQSAISNQQDQKDYIDSWVHEIKVPLSASKLLVRSIEFDIDDQKYTLLENELSKIDEYVEQVLYYARLDSFSRDYLIQEYGLKGIIQPVIRSQANYFIQKIFATKSLVRIILF